MTTTRMTAVIAIAALIQGCASTPMSLHGPDVAVVRVFFATDRNFTGSNKPAEMFGVDRAPLSYGACEVSIPRDHQMGELESPSVWRLEIREDPTKHVVLLNVVVQPKDTFFTNVAARMRASPKTSAFLFVHGYNVTFEDATVYSKMIACLVTIRPTSSISASAAENDPPSSYLPPAVRPAARGGFSRGEIDH